MQRFFYTNKIDLFFKTHPIVAILGPRQCGKTTLALNYAKNYKGKTTIFDLENPEDIARLQNPQLALKNLEGLIIIDEIQLNPELFSLLRVLVDNKNIEQKFLILGSASRELVNKSSQTLAGRIAHMELTPFSFFETNELDNLWLKGGFPKSYLNKNIQDSYIWRQQYINTFLEKDIPNLGFNIPAQTMRRFWMMLTHYHGNILNNSELGRSLGFSNTTIRKYVDILTGTFMIRELKPYFANISKRQVKSSKIYFRDSGILHTLSNIETFDNLNTNPKIGASWGGFAIEEIIRHHNFDNNDCYFWSTQNGAEIDLVIKNNKYNLGFEFKYTNAPKATKSMHIALEDLNLDKIYIIYYGDNKFPITDKIEAVGLKKYLSDNAK